MNGDLWLIPGNVRIMRMDRLWEWPRVVPPFPGVDVEDVA